MTDTPTHTYTVVVAQANGYGTHYTDTVRTDTTDMHQLQEIALHQCATAWEVPESELHVLAVMAGAVRVLYYDDSIYE